MAALLFRDALNLSPGFSILFVEPLLVEEDIRAALSEANCVFVCVLSLPVAVLFLCIDFLEPFCFSLVCSLYFFFRCQLIDYSAVLRLVNSLH